MQSDAALDCAAARYGRFIKNLRVVDLRPGVSAPHTKDIERRAAPRALAGPVRGIERDDAEATALHGARPHARKRDQVSGRHGNIPSPISIGKINVPFDQNVGRRSVTLSAWASGLRGYPLELANVLSRETSPKPIHIILEGQHVFATIPRPGPSCRRCVHAP